MARFYGTVHGRAKTTASRIGHKTTGLHVKGNGWDIGADVYLHYDAEHDRDMVTVNITGGSNGMGSKKEMQFFLDESNNLIQI